VRILAAVLVALLSLPGPFAAAQEAPKEAGSEVPRPKAIKQRKPEYPPEAAAQGLRGIVIVELIIDEKGKVESAQIVRSVPGFDEAALAAAREWEYEPTRVDGHPVKVHLTVPITFSLKLPDMRRQEGIPELRQGAAPAAPLDAPARSVTVVAEVTLASDGRVADAQVKSGESPWAEALLQALRTWRFSPEGESVSVSFRVRAEFVPAPRGGAPRVDLSLDGLRRSETPAVPPSEGGPPSPAPAAAAAPSPAAPTPVPVATPTAVPTPAAAPSPGPSPLPAPGPSPRPSPLPGTSPLPGAGASPLPGASPRPSPSPLPGPGTSASTQPPSPAPSPSGATLPPVGPPVEVIRSPAAAPAAPPPTPISAVRDVNLALGVPDLSKGRRPVVPPIARIQQATGTVTVRFAVDAAGATSVQDVSGPELLKEAARQTVLSWAFRRVTPDRLFMLAEFKYGQDTASASVRLAE
jgi:TonB family protein